MSFDLQQALLEVLLLLLWSMLVVMVAMLHVRLGCGRWQHLLLRPPNTGD